MNHQQINRDEQGIVSLIVVTILAVVLSLIAVGFSKLADRELRQASDREVAAQAYYAAESGLNDARAYLAAGGTGFPRCNDWPSSPVDGSKYFVQKLDSNGAARYSCISIDDTPQTLSYTVNPGQPRVLKVSAAGLQKLFFGWENTSYPNSGPAWLGSVGSLPREDVIASTNPGATGVLRVGIYAVPQSDNSDTNDGLASLSRTYFMYPNGGNGTPGTIDYAGGGFSLASGASGNNGSFVAGNCKDPRPKTVPANKKGVDSYCNSTLSGLDGSANTYYVYLTSQYAPLLVRIQGTTAAGVVTFNNTQGVVDVTGQGADQLQRIRARINLGSQYNYPSYAVQSMETLCKDFAVEVIGLGQYGDTSTSDQGDPACQQKPAGGGTVGGSAGDKTRH
jgi:hypothetical protein